MKGSIKQLVFGYTLLCLLFANTLRAGGINDAISADEISDLVAHLACEYNVDASSTLITQFFNSMFVTAADDCGFVIPAMYSEGKSHVSFDWEGLEGAKSYSVASMGLRNGEITRKRTTENKITFDKLSQQLYIFAFVVDCIGNENSVGYIIIIDKDFSMLREGPNRSCFCTENSTEVAINPPCPGGYNNSSFDWLPSDEEINEYNIYINQGDEYNVSLPIRRKNLEEPELWLYQMGCNANYYFEDTKTLGEEGIFEVVFSSKGIHVYIFSEEYAEAEVTFVLCEGMPEEDGGTKTQRRLQASNSETAIAAMPNPFQESLTIALNNFELGEARMQIIAADGRLMDKKLLNITQGDSNIAVNAGHLHPGIYFVQIIQQGKSYQERIVKL